MSEGKKLLLSVLLMPVAFVAGVAASLWLGLWISLSTGLMHAAYGWRAFSVTEVAVAATIISAIRAKIPTKECSWSDWVTLAIVIPPTAYLGVRMILWCA